MAKARIYGTKTTFVPNSKADKMKNKQLFFHGKDSAESDDRIDRIREKKLRKEKTKWLKNM